MGACVVINADWYHSLSHNDNAVLPPTVQPRPKSGRNAVIPHERQHLSINRRRPFRAVALGIAS